MLSSSGVESGGGTSRSGWKDRADNKHHLQQQQNTGDWRLLAVGPLADLIFESSKMTVDDVFRQ